MKPPSRLRAPLLEADAVSRAEPTGTVPSGTATAERTRPILPPVYRGKASGEFVRVSEAHSFSQEDATQAKPVSRPANEARKPQQRTAIIALAQQQLALLPKDDERRRLLELGILRGDVSLLHGLLTQFNK